MTTYVLVPGFWLGEWAWDEVAGPLRAQGHQVHAVSLRMDAGTGVEDHIAQLIDLVNGPEPVVLAGHSYGGLVVSAVADRVPERLARVVYVDAGPLPDGMCQADFDGGKVEVVDGMLPVPAEAPPSAAGFDWQIMRDRGVPQPADTATDPIRHGEAWRAVPRTGILCSFSAAQLHELAPTVPAFSLMVGDGWSYRELPAGHWPMFSQPAALAALLAEAGR